MSLSYGTVMSEPVTEHCCVGDLRIGDVYELLCSYRGWDTAWREVMGHGVDKNGSKYLNTRTVRSGGPARSYIPEKVLLVRVVPVEGIESDRAAKKLRELSGHVDL